MSSKDTGYSTFKPQKGVTLDPSQSYHLNKYSQRPRRRRSRSRSSSQEREPYFRDTRRERERIETLKKNYDRMHSSRRRSRSYSRYRSRSKDRYRRSRSRDRRRSHERSSGSRRRSRSSDRYDAHVVHRTLIHVPQFPPFGGPVSLALRNSVWYYFLFLLQWIPPPMHFPPIRPGHPHPRYAYGHPMGYEMGPIQPPPFYHHPPQRYRQPFPRPHNPRNFNRPRKD